MTFDQKMHLAHIIDQAVIQIDRKYVTGAHEHGGLLSDLTIEQLLNSAIDEATDQLVYLLTLKDKIKCQK
jgi:hypothetical protein